MPSAKTRSDCCNAARYSGFRQATLTQSAFTKLTCVASSPSSRWTMVSTAWSSVTLSMAIPNRLIRGNAGGKGAAVIVSRGDSRRSRAIVASHRGASCLREEKQRPCRGLARHREHGSGAIRNCWAHKQLRRPNERRQRPDAARLDVAATQHGGWCQDPHVLPRSNMLPCGNMLAFSPI